MKGVCILVYSYVLVCINICGETMKAIKVTPGGIDQSPKAQSVESFKEISINKGTIKLNGYFGKYLLSLLVTILLF